jgi:hypothetical protein
MQSWTFLTSVELAKTVTFTTPSNGSNAIGLRLRRRWHISAEVSGTLEPQRSRLLQVRLRKAVQWVALQAQCRCTGEIDWKTELESREGRSDGIQSAWSDDWTFYKKQLIRWWRKQRFVTCIDFLDSTRCSVHVSNYRMKYVWEEAWSHLTWRNEREQRSTIGNFLCTFWWAGDRSREC